MRMLQIISLLIVILLTQCAADDNSHSMPSNSDHAVEADTVAMKADYDSLKHALLEKRKYWKEQYNNCGDDMKEAFLDSIGIQLHALLVDSVFPCWYGTTWDFNGYTDIPRNGLVACGYFVSTPLKHAGFNLNRYKVAQQYSHSIVNTLCNQIKKVQGYNKVKDYLTQCEPGLYIVGLDNHVGYISVEQQGVYFVHSSYVDPGCVLREHIDESAVFQYSKQFVVGSFTGNNSVILKWLNNEFIQIVP